MRPIRLEMKGFTAFRDEQAIPFGDMDLFAIAGPTGSGKTSILDAITYALFGYIERVGKQVGQFVSQGQTRMAVSFEFAVDGARYRVTRSTSAKGATTVLLERWDGEAWGQAGEGSDKVGGANALIREAIGLDYDAFTRTVLLPQGRFAEFLVGDAKQRREILTDLLDLHLFERLARRAGECKRAANVEAETRSRLLETEYAGVNAEALVAAETDAVRAAEREQRLDDGRKVVDAIVERAAAAVRSVRDLRACARDVREARAAADGVAQRLTAVAAELATAVTEADATTREARDARLAARKAATALRKAEESWGRVQDLAATRVKAEAVVELATRVEEMRAAAARAEAAPRSLAANLATAERRVAATLADVEAAIASLQAARDAVDEAKHADHVAAVRSGLAVGDECPVCGGRIEQLPKTRSAAGLDRAKAALVKAEATAAAADAALRDATAVRDAAADELRQAEREAERRAADLDAARTELDGKRAEIRAAFGGRLPADPVGTLGERIAAVEELQRARQAADVAATEAAEAAASAEAGRVKLAADAAACRGLLDGLPVAGLLERARGLGEGDVAITEVPRLRRDAEPAEAAATAAAIAEILEGLGTALEALADARAGGERVLLEEALAAVDGLVEPAPTLEALGSAVAVACTVAAKEAATAAGRVEDLERKLRNAATLLEEVTMHRRREERFDALAKELRADRIISFLQLEALQLLARAGSDRLSTLSSGRYRLEFEGDEFYVVDTWNGEERRSARTLSGGETFLASLALALALSEEVGSLSVTEKARLDSLFLDEGFGTLDPDSLEVVVEAIEQLGGDGRMVGVITHVPELAARLPTTIRVEKSPRGSRLEIVA